jgi:hypothetical protein
MPRTTQQDTHLHDFGMGLLAGLVREGHTTLDERRLVDVHKGVVEAFKVIEAELDHDSLRFWMTTNRYHGTSPDVDNIFNYWLQSGFATKDSPGTVYRFRLSITGADELLETLPGGTELYDKAVAAFLDYLADNHSS